MNRISWAAALVVVATALNAVAQHPWQKPSVPMQRAKVEQLVGPVSGAPLSKPRHIVWVWGYDGGHRPGNHDYTRIRDLMAGLLKEVPRVTLETAYGFPTRAQFDRADLVVMYLHLPDLEAEHYARLDPYLERGGGLVAIHETMILRPPRRGQEWAERIGLAWSDGKSQWGALFTKVSVDTTHPIFKHFPERVQVVDEFYWHLAPATKNKTLRILGSVPVGPPRQSKGPVEEERLSKETFPVFWTHGVGKGRVFCTLPGHNTFTFYDPVFRIVLLRGLAWAMQEKPDPLMPLVYRGLEQAEGIGTTDTLRRWPDKPRNLKGEGFEPGAKLEAVNARTDAKLGLRKP